MGTPQEITVSSPVLLQLLQVATSSIPHSFNGLCPDEVEGPDVRDHDCPACQALIAVENEIPWLRKSAGR